MKEELMSSLFALSLSANSDFAADFYTIEARDIISRSERVNIQFISNVPTIDLKAERLRDFHINLRFEAQDYI